VFIGKKSAAASDLPEADSAQKPQPTEKV